MELSRLLRDQTGVQDGSGLAGPPAEVTGLTHAQVGLTGHTGVMGSAAGSDTSSSAPTAVPPTGRLPFPSMSNFSGYRPNKVTESLSRLFQPYSKSKKIKIMPPSHGSTHLFAVLQLTRVKFLFLRNI